MKIETDAFLINQTYFRNTFKLITYLYDFI